MPYYDFKCTNPECGIITEQRMSFTEHEKLGTFFNRPWIPCPKCSVESTQMVAIAAINMNYRGGQRH